MSPSGSCLLAPGPPKGPCSALLCAGGSGELANGLETTSCHILFSTCRVKRLGSRLKSGIFLNLRSHLQNGNLQMPDLATFILWLMTTMLHLFAKCYVLFDRK